MSAKLRAVRRVGAAVLAGLLLVCAVCLLLVFANRVMVDGLQQRMLQRLEEGAAGQAAILRERLAGDLRLVEAAARGLGRGDAAAAEGLAAGNFTQWLVADSAGNLLSASDGESGWLAAVPVGKALTGSLLQADYTSDSERNFLVFAAPFDRADGSRGVLAARYSMARLSPDLFTSFLDGEGFSYIVDGSGRVITQSLHENFALKSTHLFDALAAFDSMDTTAEAIRADMAAGASGSFRYTYHEYARFVLYAPFGVNDWMVFSGVPQALVEGYLRKIMTLVYLTDGAIAAVFLVLCLAVVLGYRRRTKAKTTETSREENREELLAEDAQNLLGAYDCTTGKLLLSAAIRRIFGTEDGPVSLARVMTLIHPDDLDRLSALESRMEGGERTLQSELRLLRKEGGYCWYSLQLSAQTDGRGVLRRVNCVLHDVDGYIQHSQSLLRQAELDPLTGILNRKAIQERIDSFLSSGSHLSYALFIIDLDDFKRVNDTMGHMFGDAVLMQAADSLRTLFRSQDLVSRYGGDEFVVFLKGVPEESLATRKAEAICQALGKPRQSYPLSVSVGCALSAEGDTFPALFRRADLALYAAKGRGKNGYVVYDEQEASSYVMTGSGEQLPAAQTPEDSIREQVVNLLYNSADGEAGIRSMLELLGRRLGVSRVTVSEDSTDGLYQTITYAWNDTDVPPRQDVGRRTPLTALDVESSYDRLFDDNSLWNCPDVGRLTPAMQAACRKDRIQALLVCRFRATGLRGSLGFDNCDGPRMWTRAETELLTYAAKVLTVFLLARNKK